MIDLIINKIVNCNILHTSSEADLLLGQKGSVRIIDTAVLWAVEVHLVCQYHIRSKFYYFNADEHEFVPILRVDVKVGDQHYQRHRNDVQPTQYTEFQQKFLQIDAYTAVCVNATTDKDQAYY